MAPHVDTTGWSLAGSDSDHVISPLGSSASSIVTVDSILSDTHKKSPGVNGTPQAAESRVKCIDSQPIEPLGNRSSVYKYPGADDSFIRHPKYFFADGNITFLVEDNLYCIHRYFLQRDSIYFSRKFAQLDIRDHEALPDIICLTDVERKDFDALLSILYPENFEENDLSYEEWKSVLCLSTRLGFTSIRKLALNSIEPPTQHDRLLLARKYSVDDWVVPALSAMCERTAPLTLSEARQMDIEDVIVVSTVREDIRSRTLQVDPAEIPRRVEAEQAILAGRGPRPIHVSPVFPASEASSSVDQKGTTKEENAHESDGELSKGEGAPGTIDTRKEQAQFINHGQEEVAATHTTKKEAATIIADNIVVKVADELAAKLREGAASGEKVDMYEVEEAARRMVEEAVRSMAEEAARRMADEEARRKEEKKARRRARKAARRGEV